MLSKNNIINFPSTSNASIKVAQDLLTSDFANEACIKFTELADKGNEESYMYLGALYEYGGKGLDSDFGKSRFYYEKSIESVGSVESYYGLARLYYYGKGVSVDYMKAFYYYKKVYAEYHDCFSPYKIGQMYLYGKGVEKDLDAAKMYLTESVNRGHILALSELSVIEIEKRNFLKSFFLRIKAGYKTFIVAGRSPNDLTIREF